MLLEAYNPDGGFAVRLARVNAKGDDEYLGSVPMGPDLLEVVKSTYGGGKFRGRIVDPSNRYKASLAFSIAGAAIEAEAPARALAPAPTSALESKIDRLIEVMALQLQRPAAPAVDPLDQFLKTAEVLRAMQPPPPPPAGDAFALVTQVLALRDRVLQDAPEPAAQSELTTAIREVGAPLVKLMQTKVENDRHVLELKNREQRKLAASTDPIATLAARIPATAVAFLATYARLGKSADVAADLVLESLDESDVDAIGQLSERPDFSAVLCQSVPAWSPHVAWFEQLTTAIRARFVDEESGADEPPAAEDVA